MKFLTVLSLCLFSISAFAQDVDMNRISKTTRKYIEKNLDLTIQRASCQALNNCMDFDVKKRHLENDDYKVHEKTYVLDMSKQELIDSLLNSHPKDLWSGNSLFQMSYNHNNGEILYADDEHTGLKIGELIILELTVKLGEVIKAKMPCAFEIVKVDREEGILAFSYVRTNKSKGIQHLKIEETEEGKSKVVHTTRYRSGAEFRDNNLYDPFHEQLMDDFYSRLQNFIQNKRR